MKRSKSNDENISDVNYDGNHVSKSDQKQESISKKDKSKIPLAWVDKMSTLKSKFDQILKESFLDDAAFESTFTSCISAVVNSHPKATEYSALFIDDVMRKSTKGGYNFESGISIAVQLFKFIAEKDLFERLYRQHLARRLLNIKLINSEAEQLMIEKMKVMIYLSRLNAVKDLLAKWRGCLLMSLSLQI